jgi:hypothetical protein
VSRSNPRGFAASLASVLLVAACALTRWTDVPAPQATGGRDTLPQVEMVQVWTPRGSLKPSHWWGVVVSHDSISGVPSAPKYSTKWKGARLDESVRRTLPLSAVDSVRIGHLTVAGTVLSGVVTVAFIVSVFAALELLIDLPCLPHACS